MTTGSIAAEALQMLAILPIERQGDWLDACLLVGGGHEIEITQVATPREAAAMLHQSSFDLLILWMEGARSIDGGTCDQLQDLIGHDGFAALGMQAREGWQQQCFDQGAVACLDMDVSDPITMVFTLRHACELVQLRTAQNQWESERLRASQREAREVDRLLIGQRQLLQRLDEMGGDPSTSADDARFAATIDQPEETTLIDTPLGQYYCATLQSYLFDEERAARDEIFQIVEALSACNSSSSFIMRMHLAAVSRVTMRGGAGALRHCLAGADRFLIELMMHLVDHANASQISRRAAAHSAAEAEQHVGGRRVQPGRPRPQTSPLAAA